MCKDINHKDVWGSADGITVCWICGEEVDDETVKAAATIDHIETLPVPEGAERVPVVYIR